MCAHGLGRLDEADVTLDRCRPHTLDADALAVRAGCNQRTETDEIAGGGCVGLDMDLARRLITAAGGNNETLPSLAAHGDAEARQQVQRDFDVGLGDQFADHFDDDIACRLAVHGGTMPRQRQRHQQRGQELAGHVAAHANRRVQPQRGLANAQRRITFHTGAGDRAAQLAQGVDQVADGALVHACDAGQFEIATQHRERRGQRAHGRAGVAHE